MAFLTFVYSSLVDMVAGGSEHYNWLGKLVGYANNSIYNFLSLSFTKFTISLVFH